MQNTAFSVTEGINSSVIICILLESISGNMTRGVSATLVAVNSTAKGWTLKFKTVTKGHVYANETSFFVEIDDYILPPYYVYFPAWSVPGNAIWCAPVDIVDDSIVEDTEVLILWLVSSDPVVSADVDFAATTISINEDPHDCM